MGENKLAWYRSSDKAQRGFCSVCGSALFWDPAGYDFIAVGMGGLYKPTGVHLEKHIFTADKGDYYEIAGRQPQHEQY